MPTLADRVGRRLATAAAAALLPLMSLALTAPAAGAAPAASGAAASSTPRFEREWSFGGRTDDVAGVAVDRRGRVHVVGEERMLRSYDARGRLRSQTRLDYTPTDVAVAPNGQLHVTQNWRFDNGTTWVKVHRPDGRYVRQYTLAPEADWFPEALAIGQGGDSFVVDPDDDNQALHWFAPDGAYVVSTRGANGLGFDEPSGVTAGRGRVWVADSGNDRIVELAPTRGARPDLRVVRTWGQSGLQDGRFMTPVSLALTRRGTLLVTDEHSRRVQEFTRGGRYLRTIGRDRLRENSDVAVAPGGGAIYVGGYLASLIRGIAKFTS